MVVGILERLDKNKGRFFSSKSEKMCESFEFFKIKMDECGRRSEHGRKKKVTTTL